MKQRLIGTVLAIGLVFCGAVGADSLYWSVERDGERAGYLLGTIHSEDARVLDFSDSFLQQMQACDIYAMELVPDLVTMQKLQVHMQLDEATDLPMLTGEVLFEKTARALGDYGVPRDQASRLKVWAAMMTLSQPPPETGLFMDFALSLRASAYGLEVTGLEQLEQQLAFLDDLNQAQQIELLQNAVDSFAQVNQVHRRMVDLYLGGSLQALEAEARVQMSELSEPLQGYFFDQGIDARNLRMRDRALPLLQKACTLIAVGALHLPGPQGLIQLLQDQGYELTPLTLPLRTADEYGSN